MPSDPLSGVNPPCVPRLHVRAAELKVRTAEWADRFDLTRSVAGGKALASEGHMPLGAWTHPATPAPVAELAVDWLGWLCFADDQYEEGRYSTPAAWSQITTAVNGALPPLSGVIGPGPLIRALADISHRLAQHSSPAWQRRFSSHVRDTMDGMMTEVRLRERGTPPPLAEYVELRRNAGAVIPSFDIAELCESAELPDAAYYASFFQDVVTAGNDVVCWTNDLCSVEKEQACGLVTNLVLVLEHEKRLDRPTAMAEARDLTNARVQDLVHAREQLPARTRDLPPDTRRSLEASAAAILTWVAGSHRWHQLRTDRFRVQSAATPEDLLAPRPPRP